ncbi:WAT1-related protein [Drosera capensis]
MGGGETRGKMLALWEESKPYLFLTLNQLCLSGFMILVETLLSDGVNGLAFVVYEHAISTVFLSFLAFFLERRPTFTIKVAGYAFLLALFQVVLCQMLMTVALDYISSTYESIGLNLVPSIILVLALVFGQEKLSFATINGYATVCGLACSAAGAVTIVLWKGPVIFKVFLSEGLQETSDGVIGGVMVIVGILATSFWSITLAHVVKIYPAEFSLAAIMNFFGTIQTAIIAAALVPSSSWKFKWNGGLTLISLSLGGIVVTGLSYYLMAWSIKKKGPVFTAAFNPLLVIFSFLLQTFVLGSSVHLGSILGAVLVVVGLYLLLWAKSRDTIKDVTNNDASACSPLIKP